MLLGRPATANHVKLNGFAQMAVRSSSFFAFIFLRRSSSRTSRVHHVCENDQLNTQRA